MAIYSSTIESIAANKASEPYYRFDGTSTLPHISVADNDDIDFGLQDFSFECYYKPEESGRTQRLAKHYDGTGWIIEQESSNNKIGFWHRSTTTNSGSGSVVDGAAVSTGVLTMGKWYHIVVTIDRDANASFYFNGILDSAIAISGSMSDRTMSNGSDLWLFGEPSQHPCKGEAGMARLWNIILTADEVAELYAGAGVPFHYKGASMKNHITHTGWTGASDTQAGTGWTPHADADYTSATTGGNLNRPVLTIERDAGTSQYTYTYPNQNANASNNDPTLNIGRKYRGSIWVKSGTHNVTASLNILNAAWGTHTEGQPAAITSSSSWQEISKEWISVGGGTDGIFMPRSYNTATNGNQLWSDPQIIQLGCVAEYDGSGMASDKWFDKSSNDNHGVVTNKGQTLTVPYEYGVSLQNAPSGDSGMVYEEGLYQPTIGFTVGGSMTTGNSETYLAYTRIGRTVHVSGRITLVSETSPNGAMMMTLPYTIVGLTEKAGQAYGQCYWEDPGGTIVNGGVLQANEGNAYVYFTQYSDTGVDSYITESTLDSNFNKLLNINVTYIVA